MKTTFYLFRLMMILIGGSIFFTSCSSSSHVVSSSFIQKRKYTGGYHFSFASKKKVERSHKMMTAVPSRTPEIGLVSGELFTSDSLELFRTAPPVVSGEGERDKGPRAYGKETRERSQHTIKTYQLPGSFSGPTAYRPVERKADKRRTPESAEVGLLVGILGIFLPFLGAILAIALGIACLTRIEQQPDKYKGRGWAIAVIVLGVLQIIFLFMFLMAFSSIGSGFSFSMC